MLSIRSNVASMNAQRNMMRASSLLQDNFSKLSSGYRITKASDDAAGMGVSTNLQSQIKSYKMAMRNAQDAVSVIQTTEAALNESAAIITRLRELTMQAASDGIGSTERKYLDKEVGQLTKELDRIANTTEFNGRNLLSSAATLKFQVGIRATDSDQIQIEIQPATLGGLGIGTTQETGASVVSGSPSDVAGGFSVEAQKLSGTTPVWSGSINGRVAQATNSLGEKSFASSFNGFADDADPANSYKGLLSKLDTALNSISDRRATLGATANRLQSAQNTLAIAMESATQADSRIRDVDVAEESSKLSANQVLVQAGVSMLAQANQAPQAALKLLG